MARSMLRSSAFVRAAVFLSVLLSGSVAAAQYGPPPPPPMFHPGQLGTQSTRSHLYAGIEGNAFFILKQVSDQTGYIGQGGGGNVYVGYRFGPSLSLEGNIGVTYHDETLGTPDGGALRVLNSLYLLTATVDVKVHLSNTGRLQPYVQAGLGYGYLGANYYDGYCDSIGGSCDTTFAQGPLFQLGGGFDYWFTPRITLGTRLLYRMVYLREAVIGGVVVGRSSTSFVNGLNLGINATFHYL